MLTEVDLKSIDAKNEFCRSIHTTGFAIIKNTGFEFQILEQMYVLWSEFFKSDLKYKYPYNAEEHEGFYPCAIQVNGELKIIGLLESFYYTKFSHVSETLNVVTKAVMLKLFEIMKLLLEWLIDYAEISLCNKSIFEIDECCYRIMHYPPLSGSIFDGHFNEFLSRRKEYPAHAYRLEPHKDYSHITLLPKANPDSGLEIMDNVKNKWIKVATNSPNCIIVNVGNSLQLLSNGLLKSTLHKVSLPHHAKFSESRFSSAFFV